jgi:hypothetical protein
VLSRASSARTTLSDRLEVDEYRDGLAWRPDLFLKFHDTFIDRSQWNRNAAWRKNGSSVEYKLLGIGFCAFGVFIIYVLAAK